MIKKIGRITLAGILAALVAGVSVQVSADDSTTNKPAPPVRRMRAPMFRGTLDAVDSTAKTITVKNKTKESRTYQITSETKIIKDGQPATLSDGVVGEDVGGSYTNSPDGKMIAKMIRFGKPVAPKKPAPAN